MEKKNVLLLGSGGREHTFAWKLSKSKMLGKLYIAPGNAGTMMHGVNVNIKPTAFDDVKNLVINCGIDLVVVGPEDPLVEGITDYFAGDAKLKNIPIVGPGTKGALLEGSKDFAKAFMSRHKIPTAAYQSFTAEQMDNAIAFLATLKPPFVIKADGLAAGKGVVITNHINEAQSVVQDMLLNKRFGDAGKRVVIEEFLSGIELSVFIITDGTNYLLLPEAKDYKRIGEGDTGPNTGGMGTISGVPFATDEFMKKVTTRIIQPTLNGLRQEAIPYSGFIFFGLMNCAGEPYVIEYNVRMGDPETESVLPRIENDLLEILLDLCMGKLHKHKLEINPNVATTVMLVSEGYPGDYARGMEINIPEDTGDSMIFHAGTSVDENGNIVTSGGRVMGVTSLGRNIAEALQRSYALAEDIRFGGKYLRRDIGLDLIEMNSEN